MSHVTISGLRFRHVAIAPGGYVVAARKPGYVSSVQRSNNRDRDALICCRCTAVVASEAQAERHLCLTRHYLIGLSFSDVEAVPTPHEPRRRIAIAHHLHHTDIWPHGAKFLRAKNAAPLSERYETLATLLAELAAMERAVESRNDRRKR